MVQLLWDSFFRALHGLKAHPTSFSCPGCGAAQPADSSGVLPSFAFPKLPLLPARGFHCDLPELRSKLEHSKPLFFPASSVR